MSCKIGIDVGGTFTDFVVARDGAEPAIHKVLSTPADPSLAVVAGLSEIAAQCDPPQTLAAFVAGVDTIVHGTTVTTNATLTGTGAKCALITTRGVRDALEMRRGIREEQYNNRYTNVRPLVPRYLRIGVGGRLDRDGRELAPLDEDDLRAAIALCRAENVEAVSICFMNAFANPGHERAAADRVRRELQDVYLTVSTDLLPAVRFYDRVSTTALNSYVGPKLDRYLTQLVDRLAGIGFGGVLLIMQSNGGVMTPDVARRHAALTLLSGPAGGPAAGLFHARAHGRNQCITVDMGGTSFEASLAVDGPTMVNAGEIARHRIALPMLGIHTIGAGGGSIGWIDEGGLLRMGPQSAGAAPGPACYGRGGTLPTTTDANVVLGYLDPAYFAGGRMPLDVAAARAAIERHVAQPLGLSTEQAAAGMYRVAGNNMAQGVREISIKRGFDPREFPLIVAGGAGPIHSCLIGHELDIPLQIVPREASVLCALGMLLSDLKHDFVRTFVARLADVDWKKLAAVVDAMVTEGAQRLAEERIAAADRRFHVKLDCRYPKQYHEVSFDVARSSIDAGDATAIATAFHAEHHRLYGYSLEREQAGVEIINVRVQAVGVTGKPRFGETEAGATDSAAARKGARRAYIHEDDAFATVPVYDGARLRHGHRIAGPAIVETATTAVVLSASYDGACDRHGSIVLYRKGREDLIDAASRLAHVRATAEGALAEA
jgi:N-methylhydantoinase A